MNPFKSIRKNVYVAPSSRQNKTQRITPPLMEEVNFPALGGNVEKKECIKDDDTSKILYSSNSMSSSDLLFNTYNLNNKVKYFSSSPLSLLFLSI